MKKHGKDILFCGLIALGTFFVPLLISFIFMAITDNEDIGSIIFISLLSVCGIIAPIFCVCMKKHYLIYPAVNAICFSIISISISISIVAQFAPYTVWQDGNEYETVLSIFLVPLAIGLMVFLVGIAVAIAIIASSATLLISYISKLIYDKKHKNVETINNTEITENEGT
ncbi:MAG: hypothetical protein IKJ47_02005 [Oscillospiraceae bacterium]|nr:hypothetical protein [Oscillospiraceae bacterium]